MLVLVSNCPQINNPCNGFDPTPVRDDVGGSRMSGDGGPLRHPPRRQPGRDRGPDHPHRPRAGPADRRRVLRRRPLGPARAAGRRGRPARARRPPRSLPRRGPASCGRRGHRRGRVHPGYGFLSEDAAFARALRGRRASRSSGPTPAQLELFGAKHTARAAGRGGGRADDRRAPACSPTSTRRCAGRGPIGYPVMLKATGGGGGIGMRACRRRTDLARRVRPGAARRRRLLRHRRRLPRAFRRARPPRRGAGVRRRPRPVVTLGDRDCSLQRRNQKVVEEAPAPGLPDARPRATRTPPRATLCACGRLPLGRHGRVRLRRRPRAGVLPRGQRPPAGRAPGDRGGLRRRPGRVDAPAGAGRHDVVRDPAARRAGTPSRPASTPRTRRTTTGRAPA